RREVAHRAPHPLPVAQALRLRLPQAVAPAVAPAAVGGDQQPARPRVPPPAQPAPPAADRLDGELGRVAADADAHPGLVVAQVVGPVGDRLALARVGEVVRVALVRPALGPPGLPGALEVAQNLLLL